MAPSMIRLSPASLPLGDGALIFTDPEQTAKRLVPGSPLAKIVVPRLTVCEIA
jgi:hypothetical protein